MFIVEFLTKSGLRGFWQRGGLVFLMGCLSAFSMPPWNKWAFLLLGLSGLYVMVRYALTLRGAFGYGWLFGFGYFLFSLSWIGNALLVDGNDYAWAWPLAVCGLPLLLAFFTGFSAFFASLFRQKTGFSFFLAFVVCLSLGELARGYFFTGFPWNLFAFTWSEHDALIQVLSVIGVYGLSALTIFWLSLPGFMLCHFKDAPFSCIVLPLFAIASIFTLSFTGQTALESPTTYREKTIVKVVQPNIPQHEKWQRDKLMRNFEVLLKESQASMEENLKSQITYIVWPETAISSWIFQDASVQSKIRDMLQHYEGPAYLITGILQHDAPAQTYSNSLIVLNKDAEIIERYNKHHLVPFGEYIPFQEHIPLEPVTKFSGFTKGSGPQSLDIENILFLPAICYEIIFPRYLPAKTSGVIINVTNDAWYGDSAGPYQHFQQARYRAIEKGIPVIRAANTGISAVIDSKGRILEQGSLFEQKTIRLFFPVN